MNTELKISNSISLPVNAVTERLAWLGRTGSGKTYGAMKLAEEMAAAGAQFVALDPAGVWYGLRSAADGKAPGIAIPVFGGLHGDIPLEPSAGAMIADLVVDKALSCVLDVSQFEHDTDKARFATAFAKRLFYRKKGAPSAIHLFLEECQEFLPQNPGRGEETMIHEFNRLWKMGRNFGIGGSLISQRPQEICKKALNLTECLFAFQMTGPHERKAIDVWISEKGLDQDIAADLPKLSIGRCHLWSPAWLQVSETIKIGAKWTFNASSTPLVGAAKKQMKLAEIDLAAIAEQMKATIEQAKANDPAELKKEISRLKAELKKTSNLEHSTPKVEPVIKEVPVLNGPDRELLAHAIEACEAAIKDTETRQEMIQTIYRELNTLRGTVGLLVDAGQKRTAAVRPGGAPGMRRPTSAAPMQRRSQTAEASSDLPIGERKILEALIQFPEGLERHQLTVLTGYKRSSRDTYIQRLVQREFVSTVGDKVYSTESGVVALPDAQPLPTGEELQNFWHARLPQGEKAIFEVLLEAYPSAVSRETITERTNYLRSSRDTYLQRMRAKMILTEPERGMVRAADTLF